MTAGGEFELLNVNFKKNALWSKKYPDEKSSWLILSRDDCKQPCFDQLNNTSFGNAIRSVVQLIKIQSSLGYCLIDSSPCKDNDFSVRHIYREKKP